MKYFIFGLSLLLCCLGTYAQETVCNDGIDNDGDGFVDHYDADCNALGADVSFTTDHAHSPTSTEGSINTSVSTGTRIHTFAWSNGSISPNPTNLAGGVYTVTITDLNSNSEIYQVYVPFPLPWRCPQQTYYQYSWNETFELTQTGGMMGATAVFQAPNTQHRPNAGIGAVGLNAIGFNRNDSYAYGIAVETGTTRRVFRVGHNGLISLVGDFITPGVAQTLDAGTIDDQGNFWISNGNSRRLYRVENYAVGSAETVDLTSNFNVPGFVGSDLTYDPTANNIVSVRASNHVVSVSLNGARNGFTAFNDQLLVGPIPSAYGSIWMNPAGNPIAYQNNNNNDYFEITNLATGATNPITGGNNYTSNDGFGCHLSQENNPCYILVVPENITHPSCDGASDGAINVSIYGAALPLQNVTWTGPGGSFTTEDLNGLVEGTYTLNVTDDNGCTASYSVTLTDEPDPEFYFSFKQPCDDFIGRIAIVDANGDPNRAFADDYTIQWSILNDPVTGATSPIFNPGTPARPNWRNYFTLQGGTTYRLFIQSLDGGCLYGPFDFEVEDCGGCESLDASFTNDNGNSTNTFTFTENTTLGPTVQYVVWDFGDGTSEVVYGAGQSLQHTFPSAGNYTVCMTVYSIEANDGECCSDTECKVIEANALSDPCGALFADFIADYAGSRTYQFINTSPISADLLIWDFGDGNTLTQAGSSTASVVHTYATGGNYLVTLTLVRFPGIGADDCCRSVKQLPLTIGGGGEESGKMETPEDLDQDQAEAEENVFYLLQEAGIEMTVFPNPFDQDFHIRFQASTPGELHLVLRNSLGQVVHRSVESYQGDNTILTVDFGADALGQGIYLLEYQFNEAHGSHKLIKGR